MSDDPWGDLLEVAEKSIGIVGDSGNFTMRDRLKAIIAAVDAAEDQPATLCMGLIKHGDEPTAVHVKFSKPVRIFDLSPAEARGEAAKLIALADEAERYAV